jgi:hypothetical protein
MSTKQLVPDRELLAAINPQTTQHPAPRCEKLRQIFELLPAEGKIERPELLKRTGWTDRQLERTLSAGVQLGIYDREVRSLFPTCKSNRYGRKPAGLKALSKARTPAAASPLARLNHKELATLRRVDWYRLKVSAHNAWLVACLVALIRRTRQATLREIAAEAGYSDTTLRNVLAIARRLKIVTFKPKRGIGGKGDWSVDWDAIGKLPRAANGDGAALEPQRWIDKLAGQWPKATRIDGRQRELLGAIDWRKTGLETAYQWDRAKSIVAVVGTRWEKSRGELAKALDISLETLEQKHLPWAIRAGMVKAATRSGSVPGGVEVPWDAIEKLAGERATADANGRRKPTGNGRPKRREGGRPQKWDDVCKFRREHADLTLGEAISAYRAAHQGAPVPTQNQLRVALQRRRQVRPAARRS